MLFVVLLGGNFGGAIYIGRADPTTLAEQILLTCIVVPGFCASFCFFCRLPGVWVPSLRVYGESLLCVPWCSDRARGGSPAAAPARACAAAD